MTVCKSFMYGSKEFSHTIKVKQLHYINVDVNQSLIHHYVPNTTHCEPRNRDIVWLPPSSKKIRKPWNFSQSVFKGRRVESQRDLDKCFHFDFTCSNILKFCRDEEMETELSKEIYKILKENYVYIKAVYKYYASMTN